MNLWRRTARLAGATIRHGLQRTSNRGGEEKMQHTENTAREAESIQDARETSCVVVGGGQAGAILSLLLSQNDVPVSRLESYEDFHRKVDPNLVHPAVVETLTHLGFAEQDPDSPHRELPLTLLTLLVVPAVPAATEEPASLESPAGDNGTGPGENHEGGRASVRARTGTRKDRIAGAGDPAPGRRDLRIEKTRLRICRVYRSGRRM